MSKTDDNTTVKLKEILNDQPHLIAYINEVVDTTAINGIMAKNIKIIANCGFDDAITLLSSMLASCAANFDMEVEEVMLECLKCIAVAPDASSDP